MIPIPVTGRVARYGLAVASRTGSPTGSLRVVAS